MSHENWHEEGPSSLAGQVVVASDTACAIGQAVSHQFDRRRAHIDLGDQSEAVTVHLLHLTAVEDIEDAVRHFAGGSVAAGAYMVETCRPWSTPS